MSELPDTTPTEIPWKIEREAYMNLTDYILENLDFMEQELKSYGPVQHNITFQMEELLESFTDKLNDKISSSPATNPANALTRSNSGLIDKPSKNKFGKKLKKGTKLNSKEDKKKDKDKDKEKDEKKQKDKDKDKA